MHAGGPEEADRGEYVCCSNLMKYSNKNNWDTHTQPAQASKSKDGFFFFFFAGG